MVLRDQDPALIRNSQDTRREHRFEDRFVHAFQLAGVTQKLQASDLAHLVVPFGKNVVREAQVIDGATEVVPELAKCAPRRRIEPPYQPVVSETLERFGLRHYFSAIVVSREFGWLKPHPR